MPTDLERLGNFSETRITNGTIQPIIDPLTGQPFPGNIIPANRINPLGQKMLGLLGPPNGILNPAAGQEWTSNSAFDRTPTHGRTNHVLRMDAVLTENTRATFKMIKDRDDDWSHNRLTPGTGEVNQNTPGILLSSTVTQVIKPTVVNEINFGYTHNRWGYKAADDFDYRSLYRSTLGIDPPRFEPFGEYSGSAGVVRLRRRATGRVAVRAEVRHDRRQSREPGELPRGERQYPVGRRAAAR